MLVHLGVGCLALRGQVTDPGHPLGEFLVRAWRQLLAPSVADSGWFAGAQGLDLLVWVATAKFGVGGDGQAAGSGRLLLPFLAGDHGPGKVPFLLLVVVAQGPVAGG
jgi:hypothetical protein